MDKFFLVSKTVLFGAAVATVPALLTYLGGVDWVSFGISPPIAGVIGSVIVALRFVTKSAVRVK